MSSFKNRIFNDRMGCHATRARMIRKDWHRGKKKDQNTEEYLDYLSEMKRTREFFTMIRHVITPYGLMYLAVSVPEVQDTVNFINWAIFVHLTKYKWI